VHRSLLADVVSRWDDFVSRPAVQRSIARGEDVRTRLLTRVEPFLRKARNLSPRQRRNLKIAGGFVAAVFLAIVADVVLGSPGTREIRSLSHMPVATVVLDRHDKPAFTIFEERRYEIPLTQVSPHMLHAVVAIEDQRFHSHSGLDLWRIGGSAWANLRSTSFEQGGSTITQQLAKLSFLTPDKTLRRKLKEAYLAVRIELAFTKDEILETYLNKVYFGDGYYGVEAAARGYFSKSANDLSLPEAALLAGLIQRPSATSPSRHPGRATARREVVLHQMVEAGAIDVASAAEAARTPVVLANGFKHERIGSYYKQQVTRELVERFGWDTVSRGGLKVFTSYDPVAQAAAEKSLTAGLAAIEKRRSFKARARAEVAAPSDNGSPDYLQGAVIAMDPSTGEIRALVGGRNFAESQFDRSTQARRQSGSAFKPFVYAAALERGYSPATIVTGLDTPIATPEGMWLPDDGHETDLQAMTIRAALRTSSNRAAAQLLQTIGVSNAVDYARRMGLEAPAVPSMVLGTGDVSLLSLTTAYAVFANGGLLQKPWMIRRVEDADGAQLLANHSDSRRVISDLTAFQVTSMLSDVVDRGTAWQARNAGFRLPAAGKTGTTNEYRDAWFVGYTPDLVAGVWVGFDRPRTIVPGGYASELAVPIWGTFMRDATAGSKGRPFTKPAGLIGVEICQDSGLLPVGACYRAKRVTRDGETREGSAVAYEYFRRGAEPTQSCPIHDYSWWGNVRTAMFDPSEFPSSSTVGSLLKPAPRRSASASEPRHVAENAAAAAEPEKQTDKPGERRRGFWSRLFGRGDDDDRKRNSDSSTASEKKK
jgi:penicillin-binding protein 1A